MSLAVQTDACHNRTNSTMQIMILRSSSLTTNLTIRIFMAIQAATAIIL
jgi:hypothetical protein